LTLAYLIFIHIKQPLMIWSIYLLSKCSERGKQEEFRGFSFFGEFGGNVLAKGGDGSVS
jgi:hypothetical protein